MSIIKKRVAWNKGIPQSDEAKKKNSESHKGLNAWNKGLTGYKIKPRSEESKERTSEKMKGKRTRELGYKHSDETKRKIGESNKGKNGRLGQKQTEETKRKISDANRINSAGKKQSEETIRKRSEAMKGKNTYRRSAETRQKMSKAKTGDKHPHWRNGISFEPYCHKFNNKLRLEIKERDSFQCQIPDCLCTQLDSLAMHGRRLSVHHIHYDKPNCEPALITLCVVCNNKVNFNRDYYEALFMSKLRERGLIN